MDSEVKVISIGDFNLRFHCKNPAWCQIYVEGGSLPSERYLGGDSLKIIQKRFVERMSSLETLPSRIQINDRKVCWLISLGDGHASIFVTPSRPMSFFIIFDDLGLKESLEIPLSPTEIERLIVFIKKLFLDE